MKKTRTFAQAVTEVRKSRGLNKAKFAEALGVRPASVSEWESSGSNYRPSAETCLKLAKFSISFELKLWFWRLAGITDADILSLAREIETVRTVLGAEPESVPVLPLEPFQSGSVFLMPEYFLGSNRLHYLTLDGHTSYPGFSPGDIVIVEQTRELDLVLGEAAVIKIFHEGRELLRSGRLNLVKLRDSWQVFVESLDNQKDYWSFSIAEYRPEDMKLCSSEEARRRLKLIEGHSIVGRIVAWFASLGPEKRRTMLATDKEEE